MSSEARKIGFDSLALLGAKIFSLIVALVRLKFIAVFLGVDQFGVYIFATYFVTMFSVLFDLGLPQILTRDVSANPSRASSYLLNSSLIKVVLLLGSGAVVALVTFISEFDPLTNWTLFFSFLILGTNSFSALFAAAFQAYRKMTSVSLLTVFSETFSSLAAVIILGLGGTLFEFLLGTLIVNLLYLAVVARAARRALGLSRSTIDTRLWTRLAREGVPVALSSAGIVMYMYLTLTLLKYLKGDELVAYYGAAFKFITILTLIPSSLVQVMFPFFAQLFSAKAEKLPSVLEGSVRYILIVAIPLSLGTILIAEKLIFLLFTPAFMPAVTALQILMVANLLSYANWILYSFLLAVGQQRFTMMVTLATGLVVVALNVLLIPQYGIIIPSLSLVLVEFTLFVSAFLRLNVFGYRLNLGRLFAKPLIAALGMGIIVYVLDPLPVGLQILVGVVAYGAMFTSIKGVLPEDRDVIERILPPPIGEWILSRIPAAKIR
ncbi:MAG TPA: flippase [Bacteroidota bacterium]|nr:flippase [Bacteroidota bacterium]